MYTAVFRVLAFAMSRAKVLGHVNHYVTRLALYVRPHPVDFSYRRGYKDIEAGS